jgi:TetR/AcrR family transcriptional regulator, repressor for uid operon
MSADRPAPSTTILKLSRRVQQREDTRNRLFDAALAEFRRVGFADAQIDDIVRAAGVARGTFYFHFPTKEHVLVELQRRGQESIVERLAALRRRPLAVKSFLQQLIDAVIAESVSSDQPALHREIFALFARRPSALEGQDYPLLEAVMQFFREAQERGEVRGDLMPWELTTIFLTSMFGVLLSQQDALGPELRPSLKRVIDVFVRGVAP